MEAAALRECLSGGDRRSIGGAEAVAQTIMAEPALLGAVLALMADDDPLVRMRAADAAEKASRHHPPELQQHKVLVFAAAADEQQEVRWHALQILPRLNLDSAERSQAFALAEASLAHPSRIVVAEALGALFALSRDAPDLRAKAMRHAEAALQSGPPAARARARRLSAATGPTNASEILLPSPCRIG